MRRATPYVAAALATLALAGCGTAAPKEPSDPTQATTTTSAAPSSSSSAAQVPPSGPPPGGASSSGSGTTAQPPAGTDAPDDAHGTATATGAPGPNESELLVAGEVPGFIVTGKGDLEMASAQAENVAAQIGAVTVQPATCEPLVKSLLTSPAAIYQALSFGSVQGFSSDTGQLMAEAIASGPQAGNLVVDTAGIGGCASLTVTQGGMPAQVTVEPIQLALGDSTAGAFLTQTINAGGDPVTTVTASVSIRKGQSVVALTLTGQSGNPSALKKTFEAAATNAYQKAAAAL